MKKILLLFCVAAMFGAMSCSTKERAVSPTPGQKAMIERKYGMFLHYGMNTYLNAEWSDGTAVCLSTIHRLTLKPRLPNGLGTPKRPVCVLSS